jgi:glutathione synthase/RimK-type ligase-like ATP-grasp enzyme
MTTLITVDRPDDWALDVPGVEVVDAQAYLGERRFSELRRARVFNLCRSYRYQSTGYYVSLLAAARGHVPRPSVRSILDMKTHHVHRPMGEDFDRLVQRNLAPLRSDRFVLSVYFGRTLAQRYARLGLHLYNLFEVPLLRAKFFRRPDGRWSMTGVAPIAGSGIPESHRPEVARFAASYFQGQAPRRRPRVVPRYELAILCDPEEAHPPSDEGALKRFERAARHQGLETHRITKDDAGRLAEFDALFIRETTRVNHHTYRMSHRAAELGLVVIDDPDSILRATNKVFQAESFAHHGVRAPRTVIVHRGNVGEVGPALGFPCVLKQPDGSFSTGVVKVETEEALQAAASRILEDSALLIAQEFLRTEYDWRVGVFDEKPLYACRYHMAPEHWQILDWANKGAYGRVESVPLDLVPATVLRTAIRAAGIVGDGLYGVDVKQVNGKAYVIEVNDNPSIESDVEDRNLGDALYDRIMGGFLERIERRARGGWRRWR